MIRVTGQKIFLLSLGVLASSCDCGGTPPGPGDDNRAPNVVAVESVALFPGDSTALLIEAAHDADGDALRCTWQVSPALAGVTMPDGCVDPMIAIDRAVYEGGPAAAQLTITLEVSDGKTTVAREIAVTVLDERGGDVANTSSWEGRGYQEAGARHGHCGAPGRSCKDIEDAMANLRARIAGGDEAEPLLRLATSGTAYLRDSTLLLDDDASDTGVVLSLECGFDPVSWDKVSDTWFHTPIRFTGEEGVRITASGVRLEGCDIQAAEALQPMATRTAVHVIDAASEIRDNRLHGAPPTLQAAPELAAGLYIEFEDIDSELVSVVEGNTIQGGTASTMTVGLHIAGGVPQVVGNSILGGRASIVMGAAIRAREGGATRAEIAGNMLIEGGTATQVAYGLYLAGGDLWAHDNEEILGCGIACNEGGYVGILVGAPMAAFSTPIIERNSARGVVGQFTPHQAVGLVASSPAISRDNFYRGGQAGLATGGLLAAPLRSVGDRFEGGKGLDLDPVSLADGTAVGIDLDAQGVTLDGSTVVGTSPSGASTLVAVGVRFSDNATLQVTAGSIDSGPATERAIGIQLSGASSHLLLDATTVVAGDVAGASGTTSTGILHDAGTLVCTDAVVQSGQAETTAGLHIRGNGLLTMNGGQVQGGTCAGSTGSSRGVWMEGAAISVRLSNLDVRGGDGCQRSYGLLGDVEMFRLSLHDSIIAGGQASQLAAGVYLAGGCRYCRLERNLLQAGGRTDPPTNLAVGLWIRADENVPMLEQSTFVIANRILGGNASVSQGLELAGNAGDDVVLLHNLIAGAGLASGISVAVNLSGDATVASAHAGLFVGNIIDAGAGATSLGYMETCSASGGLHRVEPFYSFNNAFWPAIDGVGAEPTAYVHRAPGADCSAAVDLTAVAAVNQLAYYGSGSTNRASVDVDPLFEADGYHLQPGSPLKDASRMSDQYWPFAAATDPEDMLDIDGTARPCGAEYDIGVHELCP
ncbi:MAG: hypothetical protein ABIJ09_22875 [Pseudomonadota bacterium]